jgi:hypothetical protein
MGLLRVRSGNEKEKTQIPFGNDKQEVEMQIPCGNDDGKVGMQISLGSQKESITWISAGILDGTWWGCTIAGIC